MKQEEARAKARALVIDSRARAAEMGQGGDKENALPPMAALPPTKDAMQSESRPSGHSLQVQQEYGPFEDMREFRTLTQSQVRACEHTLSGTRVRARTHAHTHTHKHTHTLTLTGPRGSTQMQSGQTDRQTDGEMGREKAKRRQ